MIVRRSGPSDILEICADLRAGDQAEMLATSFVDDPAEHGATIASGLGNAVAAFTLLDDAGGPVAFVGFWQIAPGVASVAMFATPAFQAIARPAHRFCRDRLMRDAIPRAFRRVECRVLETNARARLWLKRLGFREEGRIIALGKAGESFVQCAWVDPSFRQEP